MDYSWHFEYIPFSLSMSRTCGKEYSNCAISPSLSSLLNPIGFLLLQGRETVL